MAERTSLLDYARARFRLAGSQILDNAEPWFLEVDSYRAAAEAKGKPFLSFAHYDYLGLAGHPDIEAAANGVLKSHGTGASASRLVGGEYAVQRELEADLAGFTGRGGALLLVSGYLTNVTILAHLLGKGDLVLYDEFSHNSVAVGLSASRAETLPFRHNDLSHLEDLLRRHRSGCKRCLLVVESLYSMDGDIVDLPRIIDLKNRFDSWLLVDEAHSMGTLGATGRGACEHFGVPPDDIDLTIGTLSKSLVSCGGYVAASPDVIRWLRYTLPGFVFSVGISPVACAAAKAALSLLVAEPDRVTRQQRLSEFFLSKAKAEGLDIGDAAGRAVMPVLLPDSDTALAVSQALLDEGIYVPPILRVGVPNDKPRLRFFICASHTQDDIERVLGIVSRMLNSPGVSPATAVADPLPS